MKSNRSLLALILACAACSTANNPVDAGPDSVTPVDTGASGDALLVTDTGSTVDSGTADSPAPADVPASLDSTMPADATADVPVSQDTGPMCALVTGATWADSGGRVAVRYSSAVMPPRGYTRIRMPSDTMNTMCSPPLPDCGASGITVAQVAAAMANADVVMALAEMPAPLFGRDTRPVDGSVFVFTRSDGRSFTVGESCGSGSSGCRATPAGIEALVTLLRNLDAQQVALPECATVR